MPFRLLLCRCFWLLLGFLGSYPVCAQDVRPSLLEEGNGELKTVALVRDGTSWYTGAMIQASLAQLGALAKGNYQFEVLESSAEYDPARSEQLLRSLLLEPGVDVIYTPGLLGSERATRLEAEARVKPVMTGAVVFSQIRDAQISETGASLLPNLTFITNPGRVESDLGMLRTLTGASRIYVLVDEQVLAEVADVNQARAEIRRRLGLGLEFVGSTGSAAQTLSRIPEGVGALYVTILARMADEEREKLYAGLAERGIVNLTMAGPSELELGAMATLAPDNAEAVARRTAVNLHMLLQGITTDQLPVNLPFDDQLIINAEAALAIGWSPEYEVLLAAQFINETAAYYRGPAVTVEGALRQAAERNAEVRSSRYGETVADEEVRIVRSNLFPQISLEGEHVRQDLGDPISQFPSLPAVPAVPGLEALTATPSSAHQGSYGFQIRQILLNDEVWSGIRASRKSAEAARHETRADELDAMESAALAYFQYLAADALYEIEKENLRLTENNLSLAKLRIQIGAAEPAERFRWEQDVLRGKANLFQRDADRSDALIEFNRVLGAPREQRWSFRDYRLADDEYFFMEGVLDELVRTEAQFLLFGEFLRKLSVRNAPELRAFDRNLEAQGVLLKQRQRRFWLPEAAAFSSQQRVIEGSEVSVTDTEHESVVGFQFSYPVFEGGARRAEVSAKEGEIRQLEAQRDRALQLIEQRALSAFNGVAASHPNIRLSRQAVKAAQASYESVRQKYSSGDSSILDLLDVQAALLAQRQQSAIANYTYLQDVHRLQRAISWFEFEQSEAERARWRRDFEDFRRHGNLPASGNVTEEEPWSARLGQEADPFAEPVHESVETKSAEHKGQPWAQSRLRNSTRWRKR